MKFFTSGLVSKWGFQDGDQLSDLCYDLRFDDGIEVDDHALLVETVRRFILPRLDQSVETRVISTIHNPIRAETVDGEDVTGLWYEPMADSPITPEVIDVSHANLLALAKELSATPTRRGRSRTRGMRP
jgi:hypothetical protein